VEYPDEASDYPEIHEYQIVVENIQEKHPRLTQFGFGGQGDIRPEAVQKCVEWLLRHDATERRKTVNTKVSSYTWKHIVERHFDSYIANGEFICAALYLGYKMKTSDGPNAWFNIRDRTKQ
jgi:hypothetical protein